MSKEATIMQKRVFHKPQHKITSIIKNIYALYIGHIEWTQPVEFTMLCLSEYLLLSC